MLQHVASTDPSTHVKITFFARGYQPIFVLIASRRRRALPYRNDTSRYAILHLVAFSIILFFAVFTGCYAEGKQYTDANEQQAPAESAKTLDERARAYWEARVAGDLVTTFDFETDKLSGGMTLSQYVRRRGRIVYKAAKVLHSELTGSDAAVINVIVEAVVPGLPGTVKSEFKDHWVYVDGMWYHGEVPSASEGAPSAVGSGDQAAASDLFRRLAKR